MQKFLQGPEKDPYFHTQILRHSAILGIFLVFILGLWGTSRAFLRGANDFSVFYQAWQLVISGRGAEIYSVSPDRFLYAPGFAWIFAPLGYLSRDIAFVVWTGSKLGFFALLIRKLSESKFHSRSLLTFGTAAWATLMVSRPILIDLEYGQVNIFILVISVFTLYGYFEKRKSDWVDLFRWGCLSFTAVAKIFPLPLLLIPFIGAHKGKFYKKKIEIFGIVTGVFVALFSPSLCIGWSRNLQLLYEWKNALEARGLPLESHNQSFTALIFHYLSGSPTAVLSEAHHVFMFGWSWLSQEQVILLSLFWTLASVGIILGWIIAGPRSGTKESWIAILIGLLIIPSHLIWKPYFVMSLPLAICILKLFIKRKNVYMGCIVGLLFLGINFTGFDFIGHRLAPQVEAASILFIMHLIMIGTVWLRSGDMGSKER